MSSIQDAVTLINEQADRLENWKSSLDRRLDLIETRAARPGANVARPSAADATPSLVDAETGRPLLVVKAGDDVHQKYRDHGLLAGQDEYRELGLADFVRAVAGQKSTDLARRALAVGTDSAGGHLVPSALMPSILDALTPASSLLLAGAKVVLMDGPAAGAKSFTFAATDAIPTAAWRGEGGAVAESDPSFRTVVATPRSLAFYFKISRELLADATNLDGALNTAIAQAMAKALDRAGLLGSGTAPEPRGLANTAGVQTVTNGAAGTPLGSLLYGPFFAGVSAILQADGPMPTAAIVSPRTLAGLGNLRDTTNQPLAVPEMVRGIRQIATSQIPVNQTVGASTDCSTILLGDFTKASWVLRESFSIQRLSEAFATTGQVAFVAHARADFVVEYPAAFAVITGIRP
jgi:HK97 family phage major capsid protein